MSVTAPAQAILVASKLQVDVEDLVFCGDELHAAMKSFSDVAEIMANVNGGGPPLKEMAESQYFSPLRGHP